MINQTTWCSNDNLNSRPKVSYLPTLGYSSIYNSVLDFRRCSKFVAFFLDLHSKLTSWSENKNNGAFTWFEILL